jgi:hypothetical protein
VLKAEKLILDCALAALASGFIIALAIGRVRIMNRHAHDARLVHNVLGLGLLIVVLVAVAFVAGYAALTRGSAFLLVAASVFGVGLVIYGDARPSAREELPPPVGKTGDEA